MQSIAHTQLFGYKILQQRPGIEKPTQALQHFSKDIQHSFRGSQVGTNILHSLYYHITHIFFLCHDIRIRFDSICLLLWLELSIIKYYRSHSIPFHIPLIGLTSGSITKD